MRVVIAPDSFKGYFTADEAAQAMALGVRRAAPEAEIDLVPMADGGEGSLAGILRRVHGQAVAVQTVDSYGSPIEGLYGLRGDVAWIEMAQSGGLHFLPASADAALRSQLAMRASTYGTGLLVRAALLRGAHTVHLMLGGSGTTDGGYGLLAALGASYFDAQGHPLDGQDSRQLDRLAHLTLDCARQLMRRAIFVVASDVDNPLCGPHGAAFMYGPQKGLEKAAVRQRDGELMRWAALLAQAASADVARREQAGTGAAGGTAFPLAILAPNTRWISGAEFMAETCELTSAIMQADIVLTGEGATDVQTLSGKVPYMVLRWCQQHHKPCAIISGRLDEGYERLREVGPVHFEQATPLGAGADDVGRQGMEWIAAAAERAVEALRNS